MATTWECVYDRENEKDYMKLIETKDGTEAEKFKFEIERQKSKVSHKELLVLRAYRANTNCSSIATDMGKIGNNIMELKNYGVVLQRNLFNDIIKAIEKEYSNFMIHEVDNSIGTELTDEVVTDIFIMYCDYIIERNIESVTINGAKVYPIKVKDFEEELKESDYVDFGISKIRVKLRDLEYTKCNTGRTGLVKKN